MTIDVPVLDTPRLRMRGHRPDDLEDCLAMWSDQRVVRYIGGKPFSREDVWSRILRYTGHWQWMDFGFWVVEEKETGRFAGEVGFAEFRREIEPRIEGTPEIGWVLTPECQGRGYATEAVRRAVEWGEGKFGGGRTVCLIDPENAASLRVAAKCGYREFARTLYKGQPGMMLSREG